MHRQAINRGRVSYEPNSLGGGCPFQAGRTGFVSFPEPREAEDHKVRGKPDRFADHYTQARLFYNSQTDVEKKHIAKAFRFELSKVQTPAIRERMVSGLLNVDAALAKKVADGLGLRELPAPMPKVRPDDVTPEVTVSSSLSLFARPGTVGVQTRKVAILVADGCDGVAVKALAERLTTEGAVPRLVGLKLGAVETLAGDPLEVDTSIEATPGVLYDAVALPDGERAAKALAAAGPALEFLKDQYRHCKPILAAGASASVLKAASIPDTLPDGGPDPGLIVGAAGEAIIASFLTALAKHRHFERETDPPRV
jgi:catalase